MSREKQRFSIGSAHNATCATSKPWDASIWRITKWQSQSWRQSSARSFMRRLTNSAAAGHEGSLDENVYTKSHVVTDAYHAAVWRCVMLETRRGKTQRRRLLHLRDASIGQVAGPEREVSDLPYGPGSGDETNRRRNNG